MYFKFHIKLHHYFLLFLAVPALRLLLIQHQLIQCLLDLLHLIAVPLLVLLRADYRLQHLEYLHARLALAFTLNLPQSDVYQQVHVILVEIVAVFGHDDAHSL